MTRIYLAGAIFGKSNFDSGAWRALATERLAAAGFEIRDPMSRDWRGREWGNEREIVESDINELSSCHIVLASCLAPSWGTAMELRVAKQFSVPTYAVVNFSQPVSPWLRYHATAGMFVSVDDAIEKLVADHAMKSPALPVGVRPDTAAGSALDAVAALASVRRVPRDVVDGSGYLLPETCAELVTVCVADSRAMRLPRYLKCSRTKGHVGNHTVDLDASHLPG